MMARSALNPGASGPINARARGPPPLAGLDSRASEQPQLQGVVGHVIRQRPRQSRRCRPFQTVWTVDRASPDVARSRARSPRHGEVATDVAVVALLSSRFAGIPISSSTIDGRGVPRLLIRGEQTG